MRKPRKPKPAPLRAVRVAVEILVLDLFLGLFHGVLCAVSHGLRALLDLGADRLACFTDFLARVRLLGVLLVAAAAHHQHRHEHR